MITVSCLALFPGTAAAEHKPPVSPAAGAERTLSLAERMVLAKQFVTKISKGFQKADEQLGIKSEDKMTSVLPEGEELLFRLRLKDKLNPQTPYINLDSLILGRSENRKIVLSFRDFVTALEFPIEYDSEKGTAEGWYIRENIGFYLDTKAREVKSDKAVFRFSNAVKIEEGDVFVPVDELAQWFDLRLKAEVNFLSIELESDHPLPVQEALLRRNRQKYGQDIGPPVLPTKELERKALDFPFVDVSSTSNYERPGDGSPATTRQSASVRTSGDFAYGTLTTQTQLDREEKLRSLRATYSRESLEPELLGPMKARRYELGDVNAVNMALQQNNQAGIGTRVTNADPLRNYLQPTTEVSGTYFPDWDVELYRDNQLLDFQTIGDDGIYRFENVDLFGNGNNFHLVFYGPQGEIKEEDFVVPVNLERLADQGSAYDISLTSQNIHAYDKIKNDDEDNGAPLLTALYETPVGDVSVASVGLEAGQLYGEQKLTLHGGMATTLADTLLNFDAAVDNNAEMAGQIVARRELGRHQLRNETRINTDKFNQQNQGGGYRSGNVSVSNATQQEVFKNEFDLYGPSPVNLGKNTRYNLGLAYTQTADSQSNMNGNVGLFTTWDRISAGQNLIYDSSSAADGGDRLTSETTLSGSLGPNRLRLVSDYEIKPEKRWDSVVAGLQHRINKDINFDFNVEREMEPALTTATAQVNWDAGFANISPSVSYNSDKDINMTLNSRFGLVRDPQEKIYKSSRQLGTASGALSAFVFLDKDGNNQFDGEDEVIPDVTVQAPQNGGREETDENGLALFRNMARMKLTDVFIDSSTLPDPFWLPGYEGASIVPREGYIAQLEFPVHIGGEMDGTIYGRSDSNVHPLRGMSVSLYKPSGEKLMTVSSETDGFYLFSKIPPGTYYLAVDEKDALKNYARPLPQKVKIGYDGTTIYGNNIYFDEGNADVPLRILSREDIGTEDSKKLEGKSFALNLGSYKSQLMMGLVWFKVKSFYASLIGNGEATTLPSHSYPDKDTNKYTLRVALETSDIRQAYRQCQSIANKGQSCSVEILPGGLEGQPITTKQAAADISTDQ